MDREQLRTLVDSLRNKLKSAVCCYLHRGFNVSIVAGVTKDLNPRCTPGNWPARWLKLSGVKAVDARTWRSGGKDPSG